MTETAENLMYESAISVYDFKLFMLFGIISPYSQLTYTHLEDILTALNAGTINLQACRQLIEILHQDPTQNVQTVNNVQLIYFLPKKKFSTFFVFCQCKHISGLKQYNLFYSL